MTKNNTIVTSDGLKALELELSELKTSKIPAVVEQLTKSREDGDFSENSAYHAAKEQLEFFQGRVMELEEILKSSTMVANYSGKKTVVDIGCKVMVSISGKKTLYHVVGDWEAKPAERKISGTSPLGKALIGRKIGDKVEVTAPVGKVVYTIVSVE